MTAIGGGEEPVLGRDFNAVADLIPQIVWTATADGVVRYVNKYGRNYAGRAIDTAFELFLHPDDEDGSKQAWDAARPTESYECACRLRRADGSYRLHELRAIPVRNGTDFANIWVGTAIDVEASRQVESELRSTQHETSETLALLEMLLSKAPIGLGFVDRDFRRVRVNETLARYNGLTVDEQVGRTVPELVPTLWPQLEPLYRRAMDSREEVLDIEVTGANEANPDEVRHWRNSYYPVTIDHQVVGVGVVAVDDTDLKRATEARVRAERDHQRMSDALTESEESFRTVFDAAPIGIGLISVIGDHAGEFIRVNDALARLLGYPPEAIKGRRASDFSHPEDRHIVLRHDFPHSGAHQIEKRLVHSSGRTVWVEVHYSLVRDRDGAPSYFITRVEDIGTRKESERALLAALEQQNHAAMHLRKIDNVRTEMVATISHELRTPLTSIGGYLEVLADGDLGELNPDQVMLVEKVAGGAKRLGDLADDLLALARLDDDSASEGTDDGVNIEINDLARAAVDAVAPLMTAKQQTLEMNLAAENIYVRGDSHQLDRALINILSNASKYTPEGGQVAVTIHAVGTDVRIVVADDGIGIPESEQEKLFERFFRASAAQELAIKGTGLGLAIVKSIVDRHRGRITVDSAPGVGSTFSIILPTVNPVLAGSFAGDQ